MSSPRLMRLKKRYQFLCVAKSNQLVVTSTMIVQVLTHDEASEEIRRYPCLLESVRVGITVSRRIGNAVKRNRVKRRFRAVLQQVLQPLTVAKMDLVLIARPAALAAPFSQLVNDFNHALKRLKLKGFPL